MVVVPASLAAQRLPFTRYTAEDGLLGSQIWDVRQDRRGLLWIATTWGFSRFDGERFATFSVDEGLRSPSARTIVEDVAGNLWLGNNAGVARFDGRTLESFGDDEAAPRTTVWSGDVDAAGRLWFGTEAGLYRFAEGRFRRYAGADGLADDYVYALLAASDGTLWIGSRGHGLTHCAVDGDGAPTGCRVYTVADGLGADVVRALAEGANGAILVGTRGGGVSIFDGEGFRGFRRSDGLPSDDVYALLVRRSGEIVVGTAENGMAVCLELAPRRCRAVGQRNGLAADGVRALFEDRDGSLWVGTEGGLSLLGRDDLWNYGVAEGLPDPNVYAILLEGDSELWLGTFAGLARLRIGSHGEPSVRVLRREDGLPADWVWSLLRDRRGEVWVGTEGGLCRLRRERCESFGTAQGLPSSFVLALAEDEQGAIWVSTTGGLARLRLDAGGALAGVDDFSAAEGAAGERAYKIAGDRGGRLWFATGDALLVWEHERFRRVGAADGLPWRAVRGLALDAEGRLLVGGYGAVARWEPQADGGGSFRRWERASGLESRMVLTLGEDARGRFVLGTNHGVAILDPEANAGRGAVAAHLDASSGAIATEVSHTAAFAADGSRRTWFGFKGGLSGVLGELAETPAAPQVEFSRLETERHRTYLAPFSPLERGPAGWLGGPAAPRIPSHDNSLRVELRATTFLRRADLRFQYRLEGVEAEWSDPRPEPFREYTNLPPGRHRLLARAAYADGPWGEPAALELEVEPAWWQTRFFPYGAALGLAALLAAVVGWRSRRISRLEHELERRIGERTDDLARYAAALAEHLQTVDRASARARRTEEVRRDLFARTSHELRTPLTAVLGFSELLERSLGERLEEKERRYLANVRASSELLLRQVNELLDQLKLESGRMEVQLDEIALASLLESVVSLMEGFAQHRGVRLEVRADGALPAVRSDIAKLRQILMNLVSNAIKFSPAGETVEITARPVPASAAPWQREAYEIVVRDRGAGLSAADQEAAFEPYRRLDSASSAPGTGLGLPIARQFVELLGGSIAVESEPGQGASFRVLLPVDSDPISPVSGGYDSGALDVGRPQLVVLDADRDRFARLTRGLGEDEVLCLRAEDLTTLRRALESLRPRAVALPFDPAAGALPPELGEALRLVRERGVALLLVPTIGERALALGFVGAVAPGADEVEVRRALKSAGVAPRSFGRRPLVLVAAERETAIRLGVAFGAAGCDHFRVAGVPSASSALADARPDVLVADLGHLAALAREVAALQGEAAARAPGWILVEAGSAGEEELAALAELVIASGQDAASALAAALARLLGAEPAARPRREPS